MSAFWSEFLRSSRFCSAWASESSSAETGPEQGGCNECAGEEQARKERDAKPKLTGYLTRGEALSGRRGGERRTGAHVETRLRNRVGAYSTSNDTGAVVEVVDARALGAFLPDWVDPIVRSVLGVKLVDARGSLPGTPQEPQANAHPGR